MKKGSDSWNKAMLINPSGKKTSPAKNKAPTKMDKPVDGGPTIDESEARKFETTQVVEECIHINDEDPVKTVRQPAGPTMETGRNMRNNQMRSKKAGPASGVRKSETVAGSMQKSKRTPLQEFDVRAFFEENLFDIIDLEENRSGINEFEDALKNEE
jgi:hypothetical protein